MSKYHLIGSGVYFVQCLSDVWNKDARLWPRISELLMAALTAGIQASSASIGETKSAKLIGRKRVCSSILGH